MKGYGSQLQRIVTGQRSLDRENRLKVGKPPLQAPGNLAFPVPAPIPQAPMIGSGRQRGRGPFFGRYGDYLTPPIGTRHDL